MTQTKGAALVPAGDPINAAIRGQAMKDILAVGGLAAAGGIGARGLLGLKYMFGRRRPQLGRSLGPTVISIPSPVYADPKDGQRALKMAAATVAGPAPSAALASPPAGPDPGYVLALPPTPSPPTGPSGIGGALSRPVPGPGAMALAGGALGRTALLGTLGLGGYGLYRMLRKKPQPAAPAASAVKAAAGGPTEHLLSGRSELPWYLPGVTMAGIGGLAGGYKLMDFIMDKKRKADLAAEEAAARDQYRQALLDQYSPGAIPGADTVPDVPLPAKTVNPLPGASKLSLKSAALQTDLDALTEKFAQPMPMGTVSVSAPQFESQARQMADAASGMNKTVAGVGGAAEKLMRATADYMPAFAAAGLAPALALGGGLVGGAYAKPGRFGQGAVRGALTGLGATAGGLLGNLAGGGPIGTGIGALGGGLATHLLAGRSPYVEEEKRDRAYGLKAAAENLPGWAGKGLGIYGTIAGLLALGSGTAAYRFTKDRSTNRLMENAIKQRERQRWATRPPEIYAIPTPVRLTRGGDVTGAGKAPVLPGTEGM